MNRISQTWGSGRSGKIAIVAIALVALFFGCGILGQCSGSGTTDKTPTANVAMVEPTRPEPATKTPTKQPEPTRTSSVKGVGSDAILDNGIESLFVATTDKSFDALMDASVAKDEFGVMELVASGQVFIVPSGTKAKVIDVSLTTRKVRILEGDAMGKAGWVPYEFVK